eukprot:TRINITY_DN1590_c0_g1_i1.p2 TRINITY_DN1590_c0_g1~~TRINITY_DN1590_c0_g1_i1.p2  ORF type:complete len:211 (+),score=-14.82 TRINITY_DN1590_c0_g1_i1:602-1234(+)
MIQTYIYKCVIEHVFTKQMMLLHIQMIIGDILVPTIILSYNLQIITYFGIMQWQVKVTRHTLHGHILYYLVQQIIDDLCIVDRMLYVDVKKIYVAHTGCEVLVCWFASHLSIYILINIFNADVEYMIVWYQCILCQQFMCCSSSDEIAYLDVFYLKKQVYNIAIFLSTMGLRKYFTRYIISQDKQIQYINIFLLFNRCRIYANIIFKLYF